MKYHFIILLFTDFDFKIKISFSRVPILIFKTKSVNNIILKVIVLYNPFPPFF